MERATWFSYIKEIRRVDFADLLALERECRERLEHSDNELGCMICAEVLPVYTLGLRGWRNGLGPVEATGVKAIAVRRGGYETYHGPGQWVFFWVERLDKILNSGSRKSSDVLSIEVYSARLMGALRRQLSKEYAKDFECGTGERLGIWAADGVSKVASMGFSVSRGILTHGFSLNIYPHSEDWNAIHPCGLSNARAGFLEESGEEVGDQEAHMRRALGITLSAIKAEFSVSFQEAETHLLA